MSEHTGDAKMMFQKGDHVQYSAEWLASGARQRSMTVVGFGRQPHLVLVRIAGLKTPQSYHVDFIERRGATTMGREKKRRG